MVSNKAVPLSWVYKTQRDLQSYLKLCTAMIATTAMTIPAMMAIFAVFERLLRCGMGNCEDAGAPIRTALVAATIFATSDFNFSFGFAVDGETGFVRN